MKYYYINRFLEISEEDNTGMDMDRKQLQSGNFFANREDAEKKLQVVRRWFNAKK